MAEPVRKCSRCRLRVQGVRPHGDGNSYCGRCLTQIELIAEHEREQQLAAERGADPDVGEPPLEEPVTTDAPEPQPTASASNDGEVPAAPPGPPAATPEVETPEPATPARERVATAAITGSTGGDALTQALYRERAALEKQRGELLAEMQRLERDAEAITIRVEHVDALLAPNAAAARAA